jgi:hypothetical protein
VFMARQEDDVPGPGFDEHNWMALRPVALRLLSYVSSSPLAQMRAFHDGNVRDKQLVSRLRHLALRSALYYIDPPTATFILAIAANSDDLLKDWDSGDHAVDGEDARLVLETYVDRLMNGFGANVLCLRHIVSWAVGLYNPDEHGDLTLSLLKAHLTALWDAAQLQEETSYDSARPLLMANDSFIIYATQFFNITL